ncbi:hypothetical protein [Bombella saccharophila]|uniref:Flagellar biosynthesis protein FliO n=1 Tax=Bombella saccharophila TaxID=2967338 RepID=A0ABT3WBE8_9PROT|nr:hypothetical protein [Bombella saccharophila]MCX5614938.1 hypothetical protein [Bombella saccharophila]PHI96355.1 hypothetical protein BG621_05245 [Parasaccharibacter apium]
MAQASVSGGHGSGAMMQAVMGFHMNPILALVLVVGLIFITPWFLRRMRHRMPRLLQVTEAAPERALKVQDAVPLGAKRTLFSVAVKGPEGQQATAVILTGGPTDLCIGWLGDGPTQPLKDVVPLKESPSERT